MKKLETWWEAPESMIHSECDIPKELWGNWPIEEEADIACDCKERNFWNYSAIVLGSMIKLNEVTVVVLWCGGL